MRLFETFDFAGNLNGSKLVFKRTLNCNALLTTASALLMSLAVLDCRVVAAPKPADSTVQAVKPRLAESTVAAPGALTETGEPAQSKGPKVLDPDANKFNARAKLGYIAAKKIPDVCSKLFCYCGCDMSDNHSSLLDCFTSDHGADCPICVDEAIWAYKMTSENKPVADIQKFIDLKYVPEYNEIFEEPSEALREYRGRRLWKPTPGEIAQEHRKASEIKSSEKNADEAKNKLDAKPGACCSGNKK